MISETTVQRVRELDIADVVKPYTELRRHGSEFFGLCPFHSEEQPLSPYLRKEPLLLPQLPQGRRRHTVTMEKEGLDFYRAVEFLARSHNITIEYTRTEQNEEQLQSRQKARGSFCRVVGGASILHLTAPSANGRRGESGQGLYLQQVERGILRHLRIGYAPKDSRAFIDYCKSRALPEDTRFSSRGCCGARRTAEPMRCSASE